MVDFYRQTDINERHEIGQIHALLFLSTFLIYCLSHKITQVNWEEKVQQ